MEGTNLTEKAKKIYEALCTAIDNRDWHYTKEEDKLTVRFAVNGEDIPMHFIIMVDPTRQLIRLMSPIPFCMSESKRLDGAIAACVATFGMIDGSFDYDYTTGQIVYRMTASYLESEIGEGLFQYLIDCTCSMVDMFNDKFEAINNGTMDIAEFIANY